MYMYSIHCIDCILFRSAVLFRFLWFTESRCLLRLKWLPELWHPTAFNYEQCELLMCKLASVSGYFRVMNVYWALCSTQWPFNKHFLFDSNANLPNSLNAPICLMNFRALLGFSSQLSAVLGQSVRLNPSDRPLCKLHKPNNRLLNTLN